MIGGCVTSGTAPAECATKARSLAEYERSGFGTEPVWFSNAVIYIPWEGAASITPAELLGAPDDLLSPIHVDTVPADDCPGTRKLNKQVSEYRTSLIDGRGRLSDSGVFIVDCVCSARKLDGLTADQVARLYAGPRPASK